MTTIIRPAAILAAFMLLLSSAPVRAQDTMPVDLTGVWNLDEDASDDLQASMQKAMSANRQQMGGRGGRGGQGGQGGRGGGMGGPRGGGMGGPRGGDTGESRGGGASTETPVRSGGIAASLDQLLITVNGVDFEIMDGTDQTRIWTPGGERVVRDGPRGEQVSERAWWDGETLVLETVGSRMTMTRRLSRSDDGKQLVSDVTVELQGQDKAIEATLVYNGI